MSPNRFPFVLLFVGILTQTWKSASSDFTVTNVRDGEYDFIYHKTHDLLLTIYQQACYFTDMKGSLQESLLANFQNQLQERVKAVIAEDVSVHRHITTIDDMRDQFGDLLADHHCKQMDNFIIILDYLGCDFEDSLCTWTAKSPTAYIWQSHTGDTISPLTGPSNDHTLGNAGGHYVYAEANNGGPGEVAQLVSPALDVELGLCLRFWYNVYGKDVASLKVLSYKGNSTTNATELWSKSGNQGQGWKVAEISVPLGWAAPERHLDMEHLAFQAVRGVGTQSDIAIDDISTTPGACISALLGCSFEDKNRTLCQWTEVGAVDQMDWTVGRGSTNDTHTGPLHAPNGPEYPHNRYYLYMEGKTGSVGDTADLQSPVLHLTQPVCLQFMYNMFGHGVGELDVILRNVDTSFERRLWGRAGQQQTKGSEWTSAHVTVDYPFSRTRVQVLFRATRGASVESDIAIDLVEATLGNCDQSGPVIG